MLVKPGKQFSLKLNCEARGGAIGFKLLFHLSKQTSDAIDLIGGQLERIRTVSSRVEERIKQLTNVVGAISQSSMHVASAVEEQSAATQEISRSVAEQAEHSEDLQRLLEADESTKNRE